MKTKHIKRLTKLAIHIRKKFLEQKSRHNEQLYTSQTDETTKVNWFSFALEDAPRIFQKQWIYIEGTPRLVSLPKISTLAAAATFFGLSTVEAATLFIPNHENPEMGEYVTARELSNNISKFIAQKRDEAQLIMLLNETKKNKENFELMFNQNPAQRYAA